MNEVVEDSDASRAAIAWLYSDMKRRRNWWRALAIGYICGHIFISAFFLIF